jgi:hypothetical protein
MLDKYETLLLKHSYHMAFLMVATSALKTFDDFVGLAVFLARGLADNTAGSITDSVARESANGVEKGPLLCVVAKIY